LFCFSLINTLLSYYLLGQWTEVSPAQTWAAYNPTTTWANAENIGLGEIDRPGNYEMVARSSNPDDLYSLVTQLATSGLGYIYEDAFGRISYADSTHRSQYLQSNGYVNLTANQARAAGIRIDTRAGDVRNSITIKYGATSSSEQSAIDSVSENTYGSLAQIITTTLHNSADALDQAEFYLALRANPQPIFSQITFDLTNDELDNADRDDLLNVFMGQPILLLDLPPNMSSNAFQGFVEGWQFQASYNQLSVSLNLSPVAYSLQALEWNQISAAFTWAGVSGSLDWQRATIIT
jgi:hypothetical protein